MGEARMSTAPELPAPSAFHCLWMPPAPWQQWHDASDPMPDVWDDKPDEVVPHYTADQMRAYGAACAAAEREACAKLCDEKAVQVSSGDRWMHPVVVAEAIRARGAA